MWTSLDLITQAFDDIRCLFSKEKPRALYLEARY